MPGSLAGGFGYRKEVRECRPLILRLLIPSVLGGAVGSLLVTRLPPSVFATLVPWLILTAAGLFVIQGPIKRLVKQKHGPPGPMTVVAVILGQFLVAVYGGYFGAGIGILMLAVLGMMGLRDIHRMNGLKNWGGACMNFVAAAMFSFTRLVDWPVALTMALGSIAGGYAASRGAQHVPQHVVRRAVLVVGFVSGAWLLVQRLH
jgi:uncharacterized membrane protein YfcA